MLSLAVAGRAQQSVFPSPPAQFWAMSQSVQATSPFEPTVAVGCKRIIQAGNKLIACYSEAISVSTSTNEPFWKAHLHSGQDTGFGPYFWHDGANGCYDADAGGTASTVDARTLYDPFRQRFVVLIIDTTASQPRRLLLAISKDDTPDGPGCEHWHKFVIEADSNNDNFHFPGLAVNADAIYIMAQYRHKDNPLQFGSEAQILRPLPAEPWTFDPDYYKNTGAGTNHVRKIIPLNLTDFAGSEKGLAMPAQFFGATPSGTMYFAQIVDEGAVIPARDARLRVHAVTDPFGTAQLHTASDFQVPTTLEGSVVQLHQKCPTSQDVGAKGNVSSIVYQDGKLYFALSAVKTGTHDGRYVARWYVVNTNGWPASGTPSMEQSGVVDGGRVFYEDQADRPVHYIYPYIMPTAAGDVALFLTRVHSDEYVGLYWIGRRAGDPAGAMGAPLALMKAGTAGVNAALPGYWGEYLAVVRDPCDGNVVWAVGETGRCLTALPPCNTCATGGTHQEYFHTIIGNYAVPSATTHPVRRLTLQQSATVPPSAVAVLVMPPDITTLDDASLPATPGATVLRDFGHGANVTLRAPPTLDGWTFSHWIVNNTVVLPPPSPPHRMTVQMLGDRTVKPVYDAP